jgi:hypothetical protein
MSSGVHPIERIGRRQVFTSGKLFTCALRFVLLLLLSNAGAYGCRGAIETFNMPVRNLQLAARGGVNFLSGTAGTAGYRTVYRE